MSRSRSWTTGAVEGHGPLCSQLLLLFSPSSESPIAELVDEETGRQRNNRRTKREKGTTLGQLQSRNGHWSYLHPCCPISSRFILSQRFRASFAGLSPAGGRGAGMLPAEGYSGVRKERNPTDLLRTNDCP